MTQISRPEATEYAEYYARYVDRVPPGDLLTHLAVQGEATHALLLGIDESRSTFRYAPGKWSIKQLVGHVTDGERVFGYRALSFARKDPGALPGMEQDDWMAAAVFVQRPFAGLVEELHRARQATLAMFAGFTPEMALRTGVASGNRFTVRKKLPGASPLLFTGGEVQAHLTAN